MSLSNKFCSAVIHSSVNLFLKTETSVVFSISSPITEPLPTSHHQTHTGDSISTSESPSSTDVPKERGSVDWFPERSGMLIAIVLRTRALSSIVVCVHSVYTHVDRVGASFHLVRPYALFLHFSLPSPPLCCRSRGREHVEARNSF